VEEAVRALHQQFFRSPDPAIFDVGARVDLEAPVVATQD
jgi:hypothetical protein